MSGPRPFLVRPPLEARGRWSVKQGVRWRFAADLVIQVTILTRQTSGRFELHGVGVVRCLERDRIVITA